MQEALWRLFDGLPAPRGSNELVVGRLDGPLDLDALRAGLDAALVQHPLVGATFTHDGERLQQELGRLSPDDVLEIDDLEPLPHAQRTIEADRLVGDLETLELDVERGPLLRIRLVRLGAEEHRLCAVAHRLVADRRSLAIMWEDVLGGYAAVTAGRALRPAPPELDAARVAGERAELERGRPAAEAFWRERVPDTLEQLTLPQRTISDELPPRGGPGAYAPCLIPPRIVRGVAAVARRLGVTRREVYLAALATVVHRYGGRSGPVPVVVPANARPPDRAREVGPWTTPVPVIVDIADTDAFADVARAAAEGLAARLVHRAFPLASATGEAPAETDTRLRTLLQVGLRHVPAADFDAEVAGLKISYRPVRRTRADTDLQLEVLDHGDRATAGFNYSSDLFDAESIARVAGHLRTVLEAAVSDPSVPVGDLPLLTAIEQRQAIHLWNQTSVPFEDEATVHELVEAAADRTPLETAVASAEETLTYSELDARANRLANRLRGEGVRPGVRVGVLLERSAAMPVALLGILKAGGAYVPLEPDLPPERIAFALADASAPVVVTHERHRALLPVAGDDADAPTPPTVIALDTDAAALAAEPGDRPASLSSAGDLAYVLFTSGSTGAPKAAQIEHRGVVNLITWIADRHALGPDDRVILKTPYSHDISVPEFFLPLVLGGRLVIAPPGTHRDPDDLVELVNREGVTVIHFVPTMLREFLATPAVETCASLRHVFAGGEALTHDLIEQFSGRLDARLHNVYGPTEATDYTTAWETGPDPAAIAPIGAPIANMRAYVCDPALRLLPAGIPGELCVGGVGVGRGYLNRPELTAEHFVDDPFEPGGRLYRSGDICRRRPDGTLEFVRRDDGQVKIRGHRVEVGEVEAALAEHPAVGDVGVLAREDEPGLRRLVAYVAVAPEASPPSASELRGWAAARVPEFAVPAAFVTLDRLPRTASGKLDRRALPAPDVGRPDLDTAFVAPETAAERTACEIWAAVLGLDRIGLDDDFFELGGDSILAIRIASRLKAAGIAASVRSLFETSTVRELAAAAEAEPAAPTASATEATTAALEPIGWLDAERLAALRGAHPDIEDAHPVTPMQASMLVDTLAQPHAGVYVEQVVVTVEADDRDVVERAWLTTLERHAALRTSVTLEVDGRPAALVHEHVEPDVRAHDWRDAAPNDRDARLERLLAEDRAEDFDPRVPPLWRLLLVRVGERRWTCVWSHHHLLLDGWSVSLLLAELASVGRALAAGTAPPPATGLPPRRVMERLARRDAGTELAFWREQLEGVEDGTALDLGGAGGDGLGRARTVIARADLDAAARRLHVTTHTLLAGAWALVLARAGGGDDVVFGSVSSGRPGDVPDVERVVGCLLNTIPARVAVPGDAIVGDWLTQLQAAQLAGRDADATGLSDIQRALGLAPDAQLVRTLLVFEDYGVAPEGDGDGFVLGDVEVRDRAALPFVLSVGGGADELELRATFERSSLPADAGGSVLRWLEQALGELAGDPSRRLDELDVLTPEDRTLLAGWGDSGPALARMPLHELIAARAAADPGAVALRFEGSAVTRGELVARAARLAHHLRELGAIRDTPVALCMERSPELVVAMLGALMAGAPYLALALDAPPRRLAFMLGHAGAPVAVVDAAGRAALEPAREQDDAAGAATLVDVERDAATIAGRPAEPPAVEAGLDDLAYVLYTSGSTGEPKAVAQTHRTATNMYAWMVADGHLRDGDVWLFKTPYTFDVSIPDVFFPLAHGAVMVVAPEGRHADPEALTELIAGEDVTIAQFVPSMLDAFLDAPGAPACDSLRLIMAAGEALLAPHVRRCAEVLPGAELRNLYGPTETFYVTDWRCDPEATGAPPIGRPLPGVHAYVLDEHRRLAPPNAIGELWIGGEHVARGYVGRDELTAERFVADPFAPPDAGPAPARMYATGDRSRWRADGALEYFGRGDDQVKLAGQRVELGEVEAALRAHPGVDRSAVAVHADPGSPPRLVGYVVPAGARAPADDELAAWCSERLPRAWVPTAWLTLDALPMSPNGKLARGRLPAPETPARAPSRPPGTPLERTLARLWGELLGVEDIGAEDDLFALGATSMTSIRFTTRARAVGIALDVGEVFAHPTIAALGLAAEQTTPAGETARGTPRRRRRTRDWDAETHLAWPPPPVDRPADALDPATAGLIAGRGTLVTGATGFVGAQVVAALLERGPGAVYALVRADDAAGARARLLEALAHQGLADGLDADRLVVLPATSSGARSAWARRRSQRSRSASTRSSTPAHGSITCTTTTGCTPPTSPGPAR